MSGNVLCRVMSNFGAKIMLILYQYKLISIKKIFLHFKFVFYCFVSFRSISCSKMVQIYNFFENIS